MPNIILNSNEFRTVGLDTAAVYDLIDLNFYISTEYSNFTVCAIINDEHGINEICKLTSTENKSNYTVYNFDPSYLYRIRSGAMKIFLLLISQDMQTTKISKDINLKINIDKIKVSHYTLMTETFSKQLADTYAKIEELTKLNIEIYESNLKLQGR